MKIKDLRKRNGFSAIQANYLGWKAFLYSCFSFCFLSSNAQIASFSTDATEYCSDELISISNTSSESNSFEWDFCPETFRENPVLTSMPSLSQPLDIRGFELVRSSEGWFGFATSNNTSEILRFFYGESLTNIPVIENLGNVSGLVKEPEGLSVVETNDGWHIFLGFSGDNGDNLIRLDFGFSLMNTPVALVVSEYTGSGRVWDIEVVNFENQLLVFLPRYNNPNFLYILNYGDSFQNDPTVNLIVIPSPHRRMRGISVFQYQEKWYAIIAAEREEALILLDFGTNLLGSPTFEYFDIPSIPLPMRVTSVQSGGGLYATVSTSSSSSALLDFTDYLQTGATIEETIGDPLPQYRGFDFLKYQGVYLTYGFVGQDAVNLKFKNDCGANTQFSNVENPTIQFSEMGDKPIELRAYSNLGLSIFTDTLTVTSDIAPSISFTPSSSRCISAPNTFTPSNSGLTSYSWDFDGDGTEDSDQENPPAYSFAAPGMYDVRLTVSDGTCNNFYEEQITIYPDPPLPSFTANTTDCTNTDITFTNTTDESQHEGVLTYKWDFDNDGTIDSTEPNPTFQFATPGMKTIALRDSIPGCSSGTTTLSINILEGPTSDFQPASTSICAGETLSFTDESLGSPVSYDWDFDNGLASTNPNPTNILFTDAGFYDISLTVTDAQGCQSIRTEEIAVFALPEVAFDFEEPCTSSNGVAFTDLSTVAIADAVAWSWSVNGSEVSTEQNPDIVFTNTGIQNVRLTVTSSTGCESSFNEDIDIKPQPQPNFSINLACQGEPSSFEDMTPSGANPVVSWQWMVDGAVYSTPDIQHTFTAPGTYDVTLEVTGQNFCAETITQSVQVLELPSPLFEVSGNCDNQFITAIHENEPSEDPVVSRTWRLDGITVGNGDQLILEDLEENTYNLSLELETANGCLVNQQQTLEINEAPTSNLSFERSYGIPGDQLTFVNASIGATSYQWLLDGETVTTSDNEVTFDFLESGSYQLSLVSSNSLGCTDTASTEVLIAIPEVDLAIGSFELVSQGGRGRIFLEVVNRSNLPVELTEARISLENDLSVSETIDQLIGVGEQELVSLDVGIPLEVQEPAYFCVSLTSQYQGFPDINPQDNEKCLTIMPRVQVENPYPNPTMDDFILKIIVPEDTSGRLTLTTTAGKIVREESYLLQKGLNNLNVFIGQLDPGIYYASVTVSGDVFHKKIVKY